MGHKQTHSLAMAAVAAIATLAVHDRVGADGNGIWRYDQTIVEVYPGVAIDEINEDYGSWTIDCIPAHDVYLLGLPEGMEPEDFEEMLLEDPRVRDAEVNDDAMAPTAVSGDTQPIFFQVTQNEYDGQYAPVLLNLTAAHAQTTGAGVVVAVLDTGVDYTHGLLAANIDVDNDWDFVDDDDDAMDEENGIDDDDDGWIDEQVGHGTLVTGLVVLVAPDAVILPVRVLDSEGNGDLFRLTAGVYHAADNGVDVMCLGLSTRSHNHILRNAIEYAVAQGIVVVAAAGNEDRRNPTPMPAGMDAVIGVAATDADDLKADFSNYGDYVGLSAPGQDLISTIPGGGYGQASGTSLSTAIVAGVAALHRSRKPESTVLEVMLELTSNAVHIDDINPGYAGWLGAGRVSAASPQPGGFDFNMIEGPNLVEVKSGGWSNDSGLILFGVLRSKP